MNITDDMVEAAAKALALGFGYGPETTVIEKPAPVWRNYLVDARAALEATGYRRVRAPSVEEVEEALILAYVTAANDVHKVWVPDDDVLGDFTEAAHDYAAQAILSLIGGE